MPAVQKTVATPTPHFAVYDNTTGALVSIGNESLANPLPKTLTYKVLLEFPNMAVTQWDAARKRMTDRSAPTIYDRVADLMADTAVTSLTGPQQTAINTAVLAVFGNVEGRYYTLG
jgi:hypothetical protein